MSENQRRNVRVRVHRTNMNSDFLITPNDLFRGHGIYKALSGYARLLLGAGLSCADRWDTTLAELESFLDEEIGRNRHEAIRRELREHGFLRQVPGRVPAGEPDAGAFIWSFEFFMQPLDEQDRDALQAKKPRQPRVARKPPVQPVPPQWGHRDDPAGNQETPGGATPPQSGHRRSGHGQPGPEHGGTAPYIEKNKLLEELPPLPPASGGDSPSKPKQEPLPHRPGCSCHGLRSCRACRTTPRQLAAAQRAAETAAAAARRKSRVPCHRHPDQPAASCLLCPTERAAAPVPKLGEPARQVARRVAADAERRAARGAARGDPTAA